MPISAAVRHPFCPGINARSDQGAAQATTNAVRRSAMAATALA